jgi:SAM-dependent methyltransferase
MLAELLKFPKNGLEISDAVVSFDSETLERKPVFKADLLQLFASTGNRTAIQIIKSIPELEGVLDEKFVDGLLITAHCEMQRISEEFQHSRRVAGMLKPLIKTLRDSGFSEKIRIVDIGCGTGFVLRWLTAHKIFGGDVEFIGTDFNAALIEEANRLAEAENLDCKFIVANAFRLNQPAHIYLSTGILHHFRGDELSKLFEQQNRTETFAFVHYDFYSSPIAPFGSWLFHAVRMRQPLARHDGVLSAIRAYKSQELLEKARAATPDFCCAIFGIKLWVLPIPRVFHSLVGVRREFRNDFLKNLGKWRIASLGVIE